MNGKRTDLSNARDKLSNIYKSRMKMLTISTRGHGGIGRRKGLKICPCFSSDVDYAQENSITLDISSARTPTKSAQNPRVLSNTFKIKKYRNRGRGYAYIRGTRVVLVRGFVGDDAAFTAAVNDAVRKYEYQANASIEGWRGDAAAALHKGTLRRATSRGLSYSLSAEDINSLLAKVEDRCEVTGLPFDYTPSKKNAWWRCRPRAPSLDRVDNAAGYDRSNVRVVCVCVNIAINEWGLDNFAQMCRAFVERNAA